MSFLFFFFNDTATTEIYTLSLHDALPIFQDPRAHAAREAEIVGVNNQPARHARVPCTMRDRKSTRLNSSHDQISYAVFCLKKKQHYTTQFEFYVYVDQRYLCVVDDRTCCL